MSRRSITSTTSSRTNNMTRNLRQTSVPNTRSSSQKHANATAPQVHVNDGFTMIEPDQKKRTSLMKAARAEEQAYEKFKQSNTVQSVHYVAKLGGGATNKDVHQAREAFLARMAPKKVEKTEPDNDQNEEQQATEESKLQLSEDQHQQKTEQKGQPETLRQIRLRGQAERQKEMFLKKFESKE